MFVIRNAQRQALRDVVRVPFHRRILAFLRRTIPERLRGLPEPDILGRIVEADRRATKLGLRTERGVTQFAALAFLIGPQFDEIPEMRLYFDQPKPDQDTKVYWLVKMLKIQAWERERACPAAGPAERAVAGGRRLLGLIFASLASPFLLGVSAPMPAGWMAGAATTAAEGEAAAEGAAGLAAIGPVGWAILGVAALVVVGAVAYHEMNKVDSESESVPKSDAPSETESCPNKPAPEGPGPEGEDPEPDRGKFADDAKLQDHFDRHGSDFGAKTPQEYEQQADKFLNGEKSPETLEKFRSNGDVVRYNPETDEFGVTRSDGTIKTYYKPDPATHGKPTNLDYFNDQ